ncbi:DNA polymerase III chi subunit [hydrothermal vent metagenome]|uniref:DNA polymerase III chi subunit n=1 Tax=hydrothermal vent metagenome TaxID=652676 RepID=A0A3B0YFD8_9ZZZZ
MTEVDFYVLKDNHAKARLRFACRLADKVFQLGQRVFIHTESAEQSQELDTLLWTFQQNSFVPHSVIQNTDDSLSPVQIGHDAEPDASQVLINLAADVPLFFSRFERVAELVNTDNTIRQQGRSRYSFYKERGYPLRTHEIKS